MILASLIGGAGATAHQDGWGSVGPQSCFGALTSGDIEILEYSYPIQIHRYGLVTDSGGAGQHRGGCATEWEVEPIDHEMTVISFGEGRHYPALGAEGAQSACPELKVGRVERKKGDEVVEIMRSNAIMTIQPGERISTINPGGGGWGPAFKRDVAKVIRDVRNGYVSAAVAEKEYGVIVNTTDWTARLAPTRSV